MLAGRRKVKSLAGSASSLGSSFWNFSAIGSWARRARGGAKHSKRPHDRLSAKRPGGGPSDSGSSPTSSRSSAHSSGSRSNYSVPDWLGLGDKPKREPRPLRRRYVLWGEDKVGKIYPTAKARDLRTAGRVPIGPLRTLSNLLGTDRHFLPCFWNAKFLQGVSLVTDGLAVVRYHLIDRPLQQDAAISLHQHARSQLATGKGQESCWVKGSTPESEKEPMSLRLVRARALRFFLESDVSEHCLSMKEEGIPLSGGFRWDDDSWVCPDLICYLSRFSEFRSRTVEHLRMLQSRAVVWCKERKLRDEDAAKFRAPSVALAFHLGAAEYQALQILRSEEGHIAVVVSSALSEGGPIPTVHWSLGGYLRGRDSLKKVASTIRFPYVTVRRSHLPTLGFDLGPVSKVEFPLPALAWTSVHDVLSAPLSIPTS